MLFISFYQIKKECFILFPKYHINSSMLNKYENTHIEINIERAVFKYNNKITTRTPFVFAYLNLYCP